MKFKGAFILKLAVLTIAGIPIYLPSAMAQGSRGAERAYAAFTDSRELAQTPSAANRIRMSKIFRQIIRDPGNIELNVRYAKLAEKAGAPRRALAAYERILAGDPNNASAISEMDRLRDILGLAPGNRAFVI